jgi:hypothetical protein
VPAGITALRLGAGLRISDVGKFHIDRKEPTGEIQIEPARPARTYTPGCVSGLQERIRARAREFGPYIFGEHQSEDINVVTDLWRRKTQAAVGALRALERKSRLLITFRHTFARILPQRPGVTVRMSLSWASVRHDEITRK